MKLYDARLKTRSTITVVGPSQSGKSTLVEKMVAMKDELFNEPFSCVYWYCAYPPTKKLDGVKYFVGMPTLKDIPPHALVVLDDFMSELAHTRDLTILMTKVVHHLPMTLIYLTQNMFHEGKDTKTRRMNTTYHILFKNPHEHRQIDYLGQQMFQKDHNFLNSVYYDVTSNDPYGYILIDSFRETPLEIKVRSNITEKHVRVFVPNSVAIVL
jgi:hypothetical protein